MVYRLIITFLCSYLLGNLNGAVCVSAIVAHDDVRSHGSGNAGLTNFIRNYGVGSALYVILIDAGKAVIACLASGLILEPLGYELQGQMLGGFGVILGHTCPALLGFKGGKGIMSGFAIAMTIDWRVGMILLGVFAAAYLLTQYVSLGSVLGAAAFCAGFWALYPEDPYMIVGSLAIGGLAIFMHRGNIARLLKGEERKTNLFGKGSKK